MVISITKKNYIMSTPANQQRPNILFIFTDDQRFDTISALGNKEIDTPNLDRLVKQGTTFTNTHIMGGTAGAVCMPSRAMMLSGRTLFSIENQGQSIPQEHKAMPEHFREKGYASTQVGKWHQDRASYMRCFEKGAKIFGFDNYKGWYEGCNGHWHVPIQDFDPTGEYAPEDIYHEPEITPYTQPFETVKENGKHSAELFSDDMIEFIREYPESSEAKEGRPFFAYLAHLAPHDPRQYPKRFLDQYPANRISLPENFKIKHPFDNGWLYVRDELLAAFPRRPEEIQQHIADYYAIIAHVDEQVGRVLDTLEDSGQADNTIIVFAGDNGLALGQHGLMGKQNLYDHSLRVPLIIAGPKIPKNQRTDSWCYLLDIFPTLCDLTELPIPDSVEGKSLMPIINNPQAIVRDVLHFGFMGWQRAVKKGEYKLIEYAVNGKHTVQLFNLKHDPSELNNLTDSAEHRNILNDMQKELEYWRTDLNDTREMGQSFWRTARGARNTSND
jgi:arylsulfatase A-like enzyme